MFGMPCRPLFFLLIVLLSLLALFALKPSTAGTMVMPNLALANHGIAIERLTESGQNDKSETGKKTEIAHKPSFNLNCQLHLLFVGIVFGRFWAPSGKSGQMLQSLAIFLSSLVVVESASIETPGFGVTIPDPIVLDSICRLQLGDINLEKLPSFVKNIFHIPDTDLKNVTISGLMCQKKGCMWGKCWKSEGKAGGICCGDGYEFICCKEVG
ncbi:hypothetical protein niasHT_012059 [Heterodera trifolii]|uniref:Uncharacterized protein n=1 Tax=Heterodera trifolii TaxID=157864 RepID=A0ABD2LBM7_9BILA